jgi:hypothetical protein
MAPPLPPGKRWDENVDFSMHVAEVERFATIFTKWDEVGLSGMEM